MALEIKTESTMDMLFAAAREGDVAMLKNLLDDDSTILSKAMAESPETPLHLAAVEGHDGFVKEILMVKPAMAKELDLKLWSPLHFASAMGHLGVVRALVAEHPSMITARDRYSHTPLHLAATKGRLDVLEELITTMSGFTAFPDLVVRDIELLGETILHRCLKHTMLDSFKLIIRMAPPELDLINQRDSCGNTILHLAIMQKQYEAVKFLVQHTSIDVDAANSSGYTAMDNLYQNVSEMEIGELLRQKGAHRGLNTRAQPQSSQSPLSNNNKNNNNINNNLEKKEKKKIKKWFVDMKAMTLMVSTLLLNNAFQVIINPPGGLFLGGEVIREADIQHSIYPLLNLQQQRTSPTPTPSSATIERTMNATAAKAVLAYYMPGSYTVFMLLNALTFVSCYTVVRIVLSGHSIRNRFIMYCMLIALWVAFASLGTNFFFVMYMILPRGVPGGNWTFIFGMGYIVLVETCCWLTAAAKTITAAAKPSVHLPQQQV